MRTSFALLTLLAPAALAHFTLDYPATRGFDEDLEPNFCGGFNTSATRTPFPLGTGPILIDSHHPSADVAIYLSVDRSPTNITDFVSTAAGGATIKDFGTITGQGEFCFNVDTSAVAASLNVTNGTLATILVQYNGGDGNLYQCSDVILTTDYTVPSDVSCTNGTDAASSTSATSASQTSATGSVAPSATPTGAAGKVGVALGAVLAAVVGVGAIVA